MDRPILGILDAEGSVDDWNNMFSYDISITNSGSESIDPFIWDLYIDVNSNGILDDEDILLGDDLISEEIGANETLNTSGIMSIINFDIVSCQLLVVIDSAMNCNCNIDVFPLQLNFRNFYADIRLCNGTSTTLWGEEVTTTGEYCEDLISMMGCDSSNCYRVIF